MIKAGQTQLTMPEISALCLRAARGAGLGWGMAEDCAHAATWLAARDFDWADAVLYQLETPSGRQVTPRVGRWDADAPVCALHVGVALSDFATLPEGPGPDGVCMGRLSGPLMLVPFAARASKLLEIQVSELGGTRIAEVSVFPALPDHQPPIQTASQSAIISHQHLNRLDSLALKMTVPSSAISAKGAGADDD